MVSGKTRWFRERLCGFRLGGCFKGFRKGCVVSGGVVWFPARLWGHTKVCVAYDVGSLMVQG